MTIRVLAVEDEPMFAELLIDKLRSYPDLVVVGRAASVADAERLARERSPDVVVMDYQLPDGTGAEAATRIRRHLPRCAIVMLSGYTDEEAVRQAVESGAVGYISKAQVVGELVDAVRRAAEGEILLPAQVLADLLRTRERPRAGAVAAQALSARELEVLRLMGEGHDSRAIAERLVLSYHTVRGYAQNVIEKLGARSRLEAVVRAKELGLI